MGFQWRWNNVSSNDLRYDNDGDYLVPLADEVPWYDRVNDELGIKNEEASGGESEDEDPHGESTLAWAKTENEQKLKLEREGHRNVTWFTLLCERDAGEPFGYTHS